MINRYKDIENNMFDIYNLTITIAMITKKQKNRILYYDLLIIC